MTEPELYMFEHRLELGFASILAGTCPLIYKSRDPLDLESPRIEIKAIVGNAMSDHAKGFADGTEAYDAFDGSIEITVVTNRNTYEELGNISAIDGRTIEFTEWIGTSNIIAGDIIRINGATFTVESCVEFTSITVVQALTGITVGMSVQLCTAELNHARLLGQVRSRLTMRYLKQLNASGASHWQSDAVVPTDLRAQGTVDSFFDGDCIDTTVLSYYLVFSVKQTAWPDL